MGFKNGAWVAWIFGELEKQYRIRGVLLGGVLFSLLRWGHMAVRKYMMNWGRGSKAWRKTEIGK